MDNSANLLAEGLERLGLIASRIRKNQDKVPQIEIDIILEELRNLYMVALQLESGHTEKDASAVLEMDLDAARAKAERESLEAAARKAEEEKRVAAEAAARKAEEEKRRAEEAAARRAEEEKRVAAEAAARKAEEEKRRAEEAAARKAEEEKRRAEEEKRRAEEAAARKAEEEKRRAAEWAAKKAAEERRKKEAAAAAIAATGIKPLFAPEEEASQTAATMPPQMEKIEGNPNDELFADEPAPAKPEERQETSLFDLISKSDHSKRTLADTLTPNRRSVEEQLDSRVRSKKVSDLRDIININDKFSFMSELFHSNMKAYNDFILRLNAITDREEALGQVKAVATEYKWDEGSVVVKNFYKLLDCKF